MKPTFEREQALSLKNAVPPTPDMCREAVLHAVSTYKEETPVKKRYISLVAAALMLVLLSGTALALVHYYSVRDYVADGQPSESFERNVIPLDKRATSHGVSMTLGDAVFDGTRLVFTINLDAQEGATPVYLYPQIEAVCNGQKLDAYFHGGSPMYTEGLLYPSIDETVQLPNQFGVTAPLYDEVATDAVDWRFTVQVFTPNWPLVNAGEPESGQRAAWYARFPKAYENHQIMTDNGYDLTEYLDAIPVPEDLLFQSFTDRLTATGAFTHADTLVFEFTTALPETTAAPEGQVFAFDGYEIEVKRMDVTFMQINYEFEMRFDEPQGHEHDLPASFAPIYPDGTPLKFIRHTWSLEDDRRTAKVWGSAERISDDPLEELTFMLDARWKSAEENQRDARPSFTVDLAP